MFVIAVGLIVGAFIRYVGSSTPVRHVNVSPERPNQYNLSLPPDRLWLKFATKTATGPVANKTYFYVFGGEIVNLEENEIDLKVS